MPLSLIPGYEPDRPRPVRLDSLEEGQGFYLWWDDGKMPDIAGVVRRNRPGLGYVGVRIVKDKKKLVDFGTDDGGVAFEANQTKVTEWARGTLVVKEEDMPEEIDVEEERPRVKKAVSLKPPKAKEAKGNGKSVAKPKKALGPNEGGECWCNCGDSVTRRFKPGHDARFYSQLKKVIEGGMKFTALAKPAQKELGDIKGVKSAYSAHSGRV